MKITEKIEETVECTDLGNKIQSCMDYLATEIEAVEQTRE